MRQVIGWILVGWPILTIMSVLFWLVWRTPEIALIVFVAIVMSVSILIGADLLHRG